LRLVIVLTVAAVSSLSITAVPASALLTHSFATSFGAALSTPADPYPLSGPSDVAVDNSVGPSSGDIYVTDPVNHRVEKFDAAGNFILMFGKEVNKTKVQTAGSSEVEQNVCASASGDTCEAGVEVASPGAFVTPTFLAVDSSSGPSAGDIYVGDTGDHLVSKFTPGGTLITSWGSGGQLDGSTATEGPFGPLAGIAVDSSGNLFVYSETSNMFRFGPDGTFSSVFSSGFGATPVGTAVDSSDNLYVVRATPVVEKLTSGGVDLGQETVEENVTGLAIDPSANDLYVDQGGGLINHFGPNCGERCPPLDSFGSGQISGAGGLAIDSLSHTVYVANAGGGDVAAFDQVDIPSVAVGLPSNVHSTSATVNASVDPGERGEINACKFEFGTDTSYGMGVLPCSPAPPYSSPTEVSVQLSGLHNDVTYHYRLVVSNSNETIQGPDQTFTTPGTPIFSYSVTPSTTQAGGHPNLNVTEFFGTRQSCACGDAENLVENLPAGVIPDPHAVPQCSEADFADTMCPVDSQIGIVTLGTGGAMSGFSGIPVFNLSPHTGEPGAAGFHVPLLNDVVFQTISARTESDYGLKVSVNGIYHYFPISYVDETLWGVPADPSNNEDRFARGCQPAVFSDRPLCSETAGQHSNSPLKALFDNPTVCGQSLSGSFEILSYDGGTSRTEAAYPPTTGCDQLSFNPSLYAQPTTGATDTPSGLAVDLQVPQEESPSVPSPSEIRTATVTLPPGFSIDPNAADGKTACSDVEASFGTEEPAHCAQLSKVGTLEIETPALPGPLTGYVYIGTPKLGDRYRLILVADGFDVHVKLPGSVQADPHTGQLVVSLRNLPQFPFSKFNMHFFGAEGGLLATPTQCGTYWVNSTFTPWDSALPEQSSTQFFMLDSSPNGSSCSPPTRPFHPGFSAFAAADAPGAHTPFAIRLSRNDGDQNLSALTVSTPPGLSATLAGIPYCPDAAIAAASESSHSGLAEQANPSCPAASQIGTATAGAGAGSHPVYLPGKVYLAGPYKGAPLSLAVITPGISGPYDLGDVVVRAAVRVNPETAQITAVSDPLPQILEGIPLRLRSILIELKRPNFTLNPTNCEPLSVNALVMGDQSGQAGLASHFQVANCADLPFAPKLSLKLSGAIKHDGNPALTANLTAKPGEANVASTTVTLPHSDLIDNAHIRNPCTRAQFAANQCPAGSIIGFAKAETPLLDRPLEGPVYLRSAPENKSGLPDLVAALNGQIEIYLDGKIETVNGHLRTSFNTVPDAPITKFSLNLDGGSKGLLVNSENLCRASLGTLARLSGQNGARESQNQKLQTPCGRHAKHKRHRRRTRAAG